MFEHKSQDFWLTLGAVVFMLFVFWLVERATREFPYRANENFNQYVDY